MKPSPPQEAKGSHENASTGTQSPETATLRFRDAGREVRELKSTLCLLGYLRSNEVSDQYDAHTEAAVIAFQSESELPETGRVDGDTRKALSAALARKG